jgi:hypothetical protein
MQLFRLVVLTMYECPVFTIMLMQGIVGEPYNEVVFWTGIYLASRDTYSQQ